MKRAGIRILAYGIRYIEPTRSHVPTRYITRNVNGRPVRMRVGAGL